MLSTLEQHILTLRDMVARADELAAQERARAEDERVRADAERFRADELTKELDRLRDEAALEDKHFACDLADLHANLHKLIDEMASPLPRWMRMAG